jgi:prepilin-type N-terminal cleavage/methylation domain-containing protein
MPVPRTAAKPENGFSLVEVLVVVSLLSLIVLALMAVFNSTQRAFRAAATQSDVLEGGRAAMDLIASDLRNLAPSQGVYFFGAVNFLVTNNANYSQPLVQPLPGGNISRSNLLQEVFILNRQNTGWWGVAYAVMADSSDGLYSLYRLQYPTAPGTNDPTGLFKSSVFQNFFLNPTNGGSHIIDGVVHFAVRAYGPDGTWIPFGYAGQTNILKQTALYYTMVGGEGGFAMYSNNLPAAVEVDMGVLEDAARDRAASMAGNATAQNAYLAGQAGAVHVFRQRVTIPNVDRTAYQ